MAEQGLARESDLLAGWLSHAAESERAGARFTELAGALRQGVAVLTPTELVFANREVSRVLGVDPEALPRLALARVVPDAERRRALEAALVGAWNGQPGRLTVPLERPDEDAARPVTLTLRPLPLETTPTLLVVADEAAEAAPAARPADPLRALGLHLAALAGDLRGPLTAYLDHLAALEARADLPADVRADLGLYRAVTLESLDRLNRALEWGRPSPLQRPLDLADIVRRAAAAVRPGLEAGRVQLRLRLEAVPAVRGVADQLQLAIEHLLRNAMDALAGATRRSIDVVLGVESGRVTLSVVDDGPGIPPSLLPHVCDPFASSKSIAAGLGLGLTIVKDVVGRHHGDLAIRSDVSGTTVTLAFAPAEREEVRAAATAPRRVLIVDDNALVRETYTAILEASGWDVVCATDADEALRQAGAAKRVDAMLVDVQMSGRDGLAIVEALARWYPRLLPRVVLHTGYADEPRVQDVARRHGLVILTKPCRAEQLVGVLTDLATRELQS